MRALNGDHSLEEVREKNARAYQKIPPLNAPWLWPRTRRSAEAFSVSASKPLAHLAKLIKNIRRAATEIANKLATRTKGYSLVNLEASGLIRAARVWEAQRRALTVPSTAPCSLRDGRSPRTRST